MSKIRRAYPLAKLLVQLGFASSSMLLIVAWFCGERYFIVGLTIGLVVLGAAVAAALAVLLGAPLVIDDDNRGPGGRS